MIFQRCYLVLDYILFKCDLFALALHIRQQQFKNSPLAINQPTYIAIGKCNKNISLAFILRHCATVPLLFIIIINITNHPMTIKIICLLLALFTVQIINKCAYTQSSQFLPYLYDGDSFAINYTKQICKEYFGDNVCCNQYNAILTADNLKQVDGAFSTASGGCDICAINLKRLWCEYACSPRQADFLKVSKEYHQYDDPEKPGKKIYAQQANLTVEASTACAIYNSCKRVPFVASVSAMSSPAGFLNFQGHNAIDNAHQYISVFFTFNKSQGLYFGDDQQRQKLKGITQCNYTGSQLHGFEVQQTCSCNSCEQACNANQGYVYSQAQVFQGFNGVLVISIYGGVILLTGILTLYRNRRQLKQKWR